VPSAQSSETRFVRIVVANSFGDQHAPLGDMQMHCGEITKMWLVRNILCAASLLLLAASSAGAQSADVSIRGGYATVESGIRIHYLEAGSGSSLPALILIPGWRLPAFLWNEQLQRFSKLTRVIAIDPRSQGQSTKTTDGNTPEARARDLHGLLRELHVSRCVLVGWSQGAQDVAAYVQQFGIDQLAGLVFVDSPVSFGPAEIESHKEFARIILSGISIYAAHPAEYSEGMVKSLFKKPHPDLDMPSIVKSTMQTPTDTGIAMLVSDIFGTDRRPPLAKLNKAALVIASSSSPLLDVQKEMAAMIQGSKLVIVEGAGHAVFIDEPEKFDQALEAFLQSVSP
jgi:non-heme chloroperoxidase